MLGATRVGLTVTETLFELPSQPNPLVSANQKSVLPIGKVDKVRVSPEPKLLVN